MNMSTTAIQFDHVGKLYKLGLVGTGTLSHDLNRWWKTTVLRQEDPYLKIGETNDRSKKGASDYVWALKDITFDVQEGDVVGIIGKNGAGKSTLLKLLSRVTSPTTGVIRARGRIASLLEVGTGFHPELTGRENIYMNGSIMGMTRQEITRKLDEIVDFAGVERYVDTPVKRYSSGMTVRLGFAVAAFLEPEILVVDEVLAVGDAEFQKKAIGKMQDVSSNRGRTVLFVSHNMDSIRKLCKSGMFLENGMLKMQGTADEVINEYLDMNKTFEGLELAEYPREAGCNGKIRITKIDFFDDNHNPRNLQCGSHCQIKMDYEATQQQNGCQFAIAIYNRLRGTRVSFNTAYTSDSLCINKGTGSIICDIPRLPFTEGKYDVDVFVGGSEGTCDHVIGYPIDVVAGDFFRLGGSSANALLSGVTLADQRWYMDGKMLTVFRG